MPRFAFILMLFLLPWLLALVSCAPGASMPFITPPITVEGNFADYTYSAKGGLVIRPRTTIIRIRNDK